MKTVDEWEAYWATGKAMETDQWIRAIQRDALEAAAKVCDEGADFYAGDAERLTNLIDRVGSQECSAILRNTANHVRALMPKDTDHAR